MIIGYFGKPRSGKSTVLASYAAKNNLRQSVNNLLGRLRFPKFIRLRCYDCIYSTEMIKGTLRIAPYDIGLFDPGPNSLIILGEAGTYFNNRLSSKIPSYCTDFFALHGHYGCTIIWDSQSVDVDKKLRNRTEYLYHIRKGRILPFLTFQRRIWYDLTVDNDSKDLVEGYSISSGLLKPLHYLIGVNKILFRPLYYRYFDSYNRPLKMVKLSSNFPRW